MRMYEDVDVSFASLCLPYVQSSVVQEADDNPILYNKFSDSVV